MASGVPAVSHHRSAGATTPGRICLAIFLTAASLALLRVACSWPNEGGHGAIDIVPGLSEVRLLYSFLPRCAVALLAGAALGLAGTLFQQILRNPLAEPTTLGTSAGAQLALMGVTLYAPAMLEFGREAIALAGAALATLLVFGIAWPSALSPIPLVLSGIIVSLLAGTCASMLALFHHDYLQSIFIWSAGVLDQDDWGEVLYLAPRLALAAVLAFFLVRPLSVMAIDDERARGLGLPLRTVRILALGISVALSAFVVSAAGVIGFIGLAAPALARRSGARQLRDQLAWASLIGGSLLWLTDQTVQLLAIVVPGATTGMAAALLGAPLLLWMLRHKTVNGSMPPGRAANAAPRAAYPLAVLATGIALLGAATGLALLFGQGAQGWHFSGLDELGSLLQWRWPRAAGALAAGALLAVAGNLIQRMTGNAMASPEVLGISSGASFGVVVLILLIPFPGKAMQVSSAAAGAFTVLGAMLFLSRRSGFSPERTLLTGIAITSITSAFMALLMASGDPRTAMLLTWMSGSTYGVTALQAGITCAVAAIVLLIAPFAARWLDILPLGAPSAHSVGLNVGIARLALLLLTAVAVAAATLTIGPLSFVGLMAPHMARMMGLQRPLAQLFGAALLGALLMVMADWLGRNLLFPWQIPAGLLATLVGAPYLLWQMWRTARGS